MPDRLPHKKADAVPLFSRILIVSQTGDVQCCCNIGRTVYLQGMRELSDLSSVDRMTDLSVSIVVYGSEPGMLARTVDSLALAAAKLRERRPLIGKIPLFIIDNAATSVRDAVQWPRSAVVDGSLDIRMLAGHGNVGYGAGHNLAIGGTRARYHLVLNPDVDMASDALVQALDYLDRHADVVALAPRIHGGDGKLQYLCRRYPSIADLFVRGFLPAGWRARFDERLARYEMRAEIDALEGTGVLRQSTVSRPSVERPAKDTTNEASATDRIDPIDGTMIPEIISGCFMLFRTRELQALNGFDARYFLYFEDYDLSLRAKQVGKVVYLPLVNIVHFGGGASRKGRKHVQLFLTSAWKFFRRFGWRWL